MKNYTVTRAEGAPNWDAIERVTMECRYHQTSEHIRAHAQLAWTEETLLVHLQAEVPYIRAEEYGPAGVPCEDSCLEFFFCPVPGDPHYFNIEYNYNGCMYLGYGTGLQDLIRLIPDGGAEEIFCPEVRRIEGGWEIFYRIPYDFIRRMMPQARLTGGQIIRGNFYACSDLTEPPYYLSWNEVREDPFTFHRSECFGEIIIADQ